MYIYLKDNVRSQKMFKSHYAFKEIGPSVAGAEKKKERNSRFSVNKLILNTTKRLDEICGDSRSKHFRSK